MNDTTTPTPRTDAFQSSGEAHYMACDFARKLERELAQSQEANAGLMKACDALERELAAMTEQRDDAMEYADKLAEGLPDGMLPKDVEVLREANLGLATNIAAVIEQRDRLAEALRDMLSGWKYIRLQHGYLHGVGWDRAQNKAEQALQSLTTNKL